MLNTEIASVLNDGSKVYEIAEKVYHNLQLTNEDKEVASMLDAWAKEIGRKGRDNDFEISEFVRKTIQEEVYNTPDELLDTMFDRGAVGEFDDTQYDVVGKNTFLAYESADGSVVDKSFIDYRALNPSYKKFQVATQLTFTDLRKNGFKSIATLTTYAKEALQNKLFNDVFTQIDTALVSGDNVFSATGALPTATEMDALELYLLDRDTNAVAVGLSKYIQAVQKLANYNQYMSEGMKTEFNRYGIIPYYQGLRLAQISGAKKQGDGTLLIPDKRIFGVAGKIGNLDMRGEVNVYQNMDVQNETIDLYVKDFEYGVAITKPENVAKIKMS